MGIGPRIPNIDVGLILYMPIRTLGAGDAVVHLVVAVTVILKLILSRAHDWRRGSGIARRNKDEI